MPDLTVTVGAPSITQASAHQTLAERLGGAAFPLQVKAQNTLHRNLALPELNIMLKPAGTDGEQAEAEVASLDTLLRAVSTLEQIGESHRAAAVVELTVLGSEDAQPAPKAKTKKTG